MPNGNEYNPDWCRERHEDQQRQCDERYNGMKSRIHDVEDQVGKMRSMTTAILTGVILNLLCIAGGLLIWLVRA